MNKIFLAIGKFFAGLKWQVYAGAAALVFILGTLAYCNHQVEERVVQAEEIGQTNERNDQLERTIENVEKADEARTEINDPSPAGDRTRYNQCLRTARTPANCERLLPAR